MNASPTSAFSAQTLTIPNMNEYRVCLIVTQQGGQPFIPVENNYTFLSAIAYWNTGDGTVTISRPAKYFNDNTLLFDNAYIKENSNISVLANTSFVPQKIYGIK